MGGRAGGAIYVEYDIKNLKHIALLSLLSQFSALKWKIALQLEVAIAGDELYFFLFSEQLNLKRIIVSILGEDFFLVFN